MQSLIKVQHEHERVLVGAGAESGVGAGELDVLLQIIDLLPNPVYVKDREHRWMEVNKAFCDFLGYPREVLLGKSDFDFNPPDQAQVFWDMDDKVFAFKAENVNLEQTMNSDGEILWVESKKSYYQSEKGEEYIIGVLTDVTQLKAREADLVEAEKKALAGATAKTSFLANMSHEIRTPMNGVLGMAQILKGTGLTERQSGMVDTLQRSGEVLLRLIDDILDFSKLDAGEMTVWNEPFRLRDVIDDVAALSGVTARNKGLDLIVNYAPCLPHALVGDADRINQILTNLIGNAIKFTSEGFVLLDVGGSLDGQNFNLNIRVKDTGIGIARDKLLRIFEKFQQADGSTTRIYGGTGLGLAISRDLAEVMGGGLSALSVEGEGSSFDFSVSLPVTEMSEKSPHSPIDLSSLTTLKILAVDDISLNLDILEAQLGMLSLSLDRATSAEAAVLALSKAVNAGTPYNLLLMDYQMPEIDGLKLAGSLRRHPQFNNLQMIVLSSVNDIQVRRAFTKLDVASYLVKPAAQTELHQAIAQVALQI